MPQSFKTFKYNQGHLPWRWDFAVLLIAFFVVASLAWWYLARAPQKACRVITSAEADTVVENGKRKAALDVRTLNLKPGECLTVRP